MHAQAGPYVVKHDDGTWTVGMQQGTAGGVKQPTITSFSTPFSPPLVRADCYFYFRDNATGLITVDPAGALQHRRDGEIAERIDDRPDQRDPPRDARPAAPAPPPARVPSPPADPASPGSATSFRGKWARTTATRRVNWSLAHTFGGGGGTRIERTYEGAPP